MEEQRNKVMQNKRRMSVLAKDRINQMNGKVAMNRGANRMDLSAFGKKKKTKTKRKKKEVKEVKEKPKMSGTSLLGQDEIKQLSRERKDSDAKRRASRKKKRGQGVGG